MYGEIDVEKLRKDMYDDSIGAAFVGGFGGSLMESSDIQRASSEKLVEMAKRKGINLSEYKD